MVVLTGGPCAGKTTALSQLNDWLSQAGRKVFIAHEVATRLIEAGFNKRSPSFQPAILRQQLAFEDLCLEEADSLEQPSVILCDRGALDVLAYCDWEEFVEMMTLLGNNLSTIMHRYSGVIHMVTAANGAEEFYTTENNQARDESPETARKLDQKTQNAWVGHPHLIVIGNENKDFQTKLLRTRQALARVLGIPEPIEIERKYLLASVEWNALPSHTSKVSISQTYLRPTNVALDRRVRKRSIDGIACYFFTEKRDLRPKVRVEQERQIDAREYLTLLEEADPKRSKIIKTRHCFVWENQYFELDVFQQPANLFGKIILEIELSSEQTEVSLPPFVKVEKEVTDDPSFRNRNLALRRS